MLSIIWRQYIFSWCHVKQKNAALFSGYAIWSAAIIRRFPSWRSRRLLRWRSEAPQAQCQSGEAVKHGITALHVGK